MNNDDNFENWINKHPFAVALLHKFIDKIDKKQTRLSIKVTKKTLPELFDFKYQADNPALFWSLIEELADTFGILKIKKYKPSPLDEEYTNAILTFNKDCEELIRECLNRSIKMDPATIWRNAYDDVPPTKLKSTDPKLREACLTHHQKSASDILQGFVELHECLETTQQVYTLRGLSAKFFWGDSKYLDNKFDLISTVFYKHKHRIRNRQILINIAIVKPMKTVLFVENQDTFLQLTNIQKDHTYLNTTAIVYSSGFTGSAKRIRHKGNTDFSYMHPNIAEQTTLYFETWWFHNHHQINSYFWGDLDYSGMTILASLQDIFPPLSSWKVGYAPMLNRLKQGYGHYPSDAKKNKTEQKDPHTTGCIFADSILLPAIRKTSTFIDQEAIMMHELIDGLCS